MARRRGPIETPAQQQAREIKEMMDNWANSAPITPAPSVPAYTTTAPVGPAPAAQPFRLRDLAKEIQLMICKAALLEGGEIDIMDDSRDYLELMKANKEMLAVAKGAEKELVRDHKLFKATCHTR